MKIVYGLSRIGRYTRPVVALGVFDGLHVAHTRIVREAVQKARAIKGTSIVVTFWPHPRGKESLYSLRHRLGLIEQLGVDVCIVVKFDAAFSSMSARDFAHTVIAGKLGACFVYVGRNFRFGRGAAGDVSLLKRLSGPLGFSVKVFEVVRIGGVPVSSTHIRRLIASGELKAAEKFLGKPVTILGTVVKGELVAARLGFATANINPHHEVVPPAGVYAVRALLGKRLHPGVCYIGSKPTLARNKRRARPRSIEVHLFNFNKKIYGRDLEVRFVRFIRPEKKFASKQALIARIKEDVRSAKEILSLH